MKEVIDFLNSHKTGCFATVDNGKPRVRPWAFMLEQEGKFWFCTANTKDVYKQLKSNPYMEFTAWEGFNILRISGEVQFSQDANMKSKILEANPGVKSLYKSSDNPAFLNVLDYNPLTEKVGGLFIWILLRCPYLFLVISELTI